MSTNFPGFAPAFVRYVRHCFKFGLLHIHRVRRFGRFGCCRCVPSDLVIGDGAWRPRFGGMLDRCLKKPRPPGPMDFLRFPFGSSHQLSPGKVFHHDLQGSIRISGGIEQPDFFHPSTVQDTVGNEGLDWDPFTKNLTSC